MQNYRKVKTFLEHSEMVLQDSASQRKLPDILQGIKRSGDNLCQNEQNTSLKFQTCRLKTDALILHRNFTCLLRQPDVFVISRIWKLLAIYFQLTQVIFYPSGVFDGIEDQIVIIIVFLSYDKRKISYKTLDSQRWDDRILSLILLNRNRLAIVTVIIDKHAKVWRATFVRVFFAFFEVHGDLH